MLLLFTDRASLRQNKSKISFKKLQSWSSKIESRADFMPIHSCSRRLSRDGAIRRSTITRNQENKDTRQEKSYGVRFAKTKHCIKQDEPITPQQALDYWYNPVEISAMKEEAELMANLHAAGKLYLDESKCPQRGLEPYVEMASGDSAKQSRLAVIEEQRIQRKKGGCCPEKMQQRIERSYTTYTQGSCIQAQLLAVSDAVAAGRAA